MYIYMSAISFIYIYIYIHIYIHIHINSACSEELVVFTTLFKFEAQNQNKVYNLMKIASSDGL